MKVLVVCQHYWPEPFNTADVCESLVDHGFEVTVLTGLPNTGMPGNNVPKEYLRRDAVEEERNGVKILRVKTHPRRYSALDRVFNYLSFWRNGNALARSLNEEFDIVLGYQFSPVMQVDPGIVYAKKNYVPMLLYCFDLWPVSLTAGGFSEQSIPYRWIKSVSKRIYSEADRIAITSPLFKEYFKNDLGLDKTGFIYLPQFSNDLLTESWSGKKPDGYDEDLINLTFAGNVGKAQSVLTIVESASLLQGNSNVYFHVVGSGSALDQCQNKALELNLSNISFHGRLDSAEMPAYYAASDAMLVTFEDSPMARYTLPRKVTSCLAAGRPVLAAAEGETARIIKEASCGICCATADAAGLARIVREFVAMPLQEREKFGRNARAYYKSYFSKEMFFDKLEDLLRDLAKENA